MPGGQNFRQWYAMRRAMQQRGTWHGSNAPTHSVPALEEGEPPPQRPRRSGTLQTRADQDSTPEGSPNDPIAGFTPESSSSSDSLPPLESSPTSEGTLWHIMALRYLHGLKLILRYYGMLTLMMRLIESLKNSLLILIACWVFVGIWICIWFLLMVLDMLMGLILESLLLRKLFLMLLAT